MMKLKNNAFAIALSSAVLALPLMVGACSNSGEPSSSQAESSGAEVAQDHTGMHHGTMNMSLGPKNETFDLRFIDAMIPHHQGAIAMAQVAQEKSTRPEIKQLTQAIIAAQEKEIEQMQAWRKAWYPNADEQAVMYDKTMNMDMPMSEQMRSDMMMSGDLGAADDQFDLRFIEAMIPHHEGALVMAHEALQKSDRPEIKQLAQSILSSQQQEIDQMTTWKQSWYAK
jgi:uncharacterized protein (DUF305 family)